MADNGSGVPELLKKLVGPIWATDAFPFHQPHSLCSLSKFLTALCNVHDRLQVIY